MTISIVNVPLCAFPKLPLQYVPQKLTFDADGELGVNEEPHAASTVIVAEALTTMSER